MGQHLCSKDGEDRAASDTGRCAPQIMKKIIIAFFILSANLAIAEDIKLPSEVYNDMGYRVVGSEVLYPTPWEKRKFNVLEKSITKIKSIEQVPGEPNWYYRFEVIVEKLPDPRAAVKRAKRILKKPPGLSPSENKAFPLRKAFQKGVFVYTISTDVNLYYITELDRVLSKLQQSMESKY